MNLRVGSAAYNKEVKDQFKKEAMALLRKVAKLLNFDPKTFDLRFNAAGIACSGDATLHANAVYVTLNLEHDLGVLVRTCTSRRDYSGGPNRWYKFSQLKQEGPAGLAEFIRHIMDGC